MAGSFGRARAKKKRTAYLITIRFVRNAYAIYETSFSRTLYRPSVTFSDYLQSGFPSAKSTPIFSSLSMTKSSAKKINSSRLRRAANCHYDVINAKRTVIVRVRRNRNGAYRGKTVNKTELLCTTGFRIRHTRRRDLRRPERRADIQRDFYFYFF